MKPEPSPQAQAHGNRGRPFRWTGQSDFDRLTLRVFVLGCPLLTSAGVGAVAQPPGGRAAA